jgi:hypothetical protein
MVKASALQRITDFKAFNEQNDPHQGHDYGSFDHCGLEVWWKIDYYAPSLEAAWKILPTPLKPNAS